MTSVADLAYRRHHGFFGQPLRSIVLLEATALNTSQVRAMRSAVSSILISVLFKTTRLAKKASRVDSSRGAEI